MNDSWSGVMMKWKWTDILAEAEEQSKQGNRSFFIAHLLDRVLLGKIGDKQDYPILKNAADQGRILDLHIFNHLKEVFAVCENDRVVRYSDLKHRDDMEYIEFEYELENRYFYSHRDPAFRSVVARTYLEENVQKDLIMPRIKQTVLYELK